ncbi:unnamed protein product [Sympodiomycopsis kandeliae]
MIFSFKPPVRVRAETFKHLILHIDWIGTVAILSSVICILLVLQWGGITYLWGSSQIIGLLVGSVLLFAVFIGNQIYLGDGATLVPRVFKLRSIWTAGAYNFCYGSYFFTITYFVPIYFQAVKDSSALISGVQTIPMIVGVVVFSTLSGIIVTKLGYYTPGKPCRTTLGTVLKPTRSDSCRYSDDGGRSHGRCRCNLTARMGSTHGPPRIGDLEISLADFAVDKLFKPMLEYLVDSVQAGNQGLFVEEAWSIDMAGHGDSREVDIQGNLLGPWPIDAKDYMRDVLTFAALYLPRERPHEAMSSALSPSAASLKALSAPEGTVQTRKNLVAIGHSIGGETMLGVSLHAPMLFAAVAAIEPIVLDAATSTFGLRLPLARFAMKKKCFYDSREQARREIAQHPVFQLYSPEVQAKFLIAYNDHQTVLSLASRGSNQHTSLAFKPIRVRGT